MRIATSPEVDRRLQRIVVDQLEKHLHVRARLGGFEKNLFMTRVTLTDVTLRDLTGSGRSITTTRLVVTIDPYAFLRGSLALKTVQLEGVFLDIVRKLDGTISIEPLFPFWLNDTGSKRKPRFPMKFEIGEVILIGGGISYTDEPAGFVLTTRDVVIALTRGRFDPRNQRDISLRTGEGEVGWRVFPEGRSVRLESLHANLVFTPSDLRIRNLVLATEIFSMDLSGKVPFTGESELAGDLSLRINLNRLPWLIPDSGGEITLSGSVGGKLLDPSFRGQLSGKDFRITGRDLQRIEADIYADAAGCNIHSANVGYKGEEVDGLLSLRFERGIPFDLEAETQRYPFFKLTEEIRGFELPLEGIVNAAIKASGNLSDMASSITIDGRLDLPLSREKTVEMPFHLKGQYMVEGLEDLDLRIQAGNVLLVMGGSLTSEGPDLKVVAAADELAYWNDIQALKGFKGSLEMQAEISGNWSNARARIDATVSRPGWNDLSGDLVRIHLDVDKGGISLPMVSMETGSSTIVGRANIPWSRPPGGHWFVIEVTRGRVEDLVRSAGIDLVLTGSVKGYVEASLTESGWEADLNATLESGRILEETYDQISAKGIYKGGKIEVEQLDILKDERRVRGSGRIADGKFQAGFTSVDPVLLEGVRYLQKLKVVLAGDVSMETSLRGNLDGTDLTVDTELTWDQITFDGRAWRKGTAQFRIRDRRLLAEARLLDGVFEAMAEADLKGKYPFAGTIRTEEDADREALNDLLGLRIPADSVSGSLRAEADAKGILKSLKKTKVNGIISSADLRIKGIQFQAQENVRFTYSPELGIRFLDAALWSGESVIGGTLLIAPGTALDGDLNGSVDLKGITFLKPTVDDFSGQAVVKLRVTGTLLEPVLNGSIRLSGARCTAHIPFDLPVEELEGNLEIVGNRLRSGGITGMSEGGSIRMDGDLFLERFKPVQGELRWKAESIPIRFPEGLSTINRADIALKFSDGLGVLRGTVSMDEGRYERQVNIDNLIALIGERGLIQGVSEPDDSTGQGGDWLTLDIEMETTSPVVIDIKLLRGTASGNLHLQGTAARPVLAGRMEMVEGTIEYRGHSFDVTSGSVGFFNPAQIEPAFDFTARTEVTGLDRDGVVTEYIVDLLATGIPEKFKLDLVSSPPLSEIDIVSLLTWGAVGEQAFASRSGLSAAEVTLLLTRGLKGTLETGVRQLTGFDRVVINPSAVTSSGERTTRIQMDKKLSESFYLTYSTPVLTSEEQEVLLKYRISDSFSLIGEQMGEKDYGFDLDFQFQIP